MLDPSDYELEKVEPPPPTLPEKRLTLRWVVVGIAIIGAATAAWFFFGRRTEPPASEPVAAVPPSTPPPAARALCETTETVVVPTLDEADGMVGKLVGGLSSHPRVAAWLTTDNLIRNFTVVVENIANGETPAPHLQTLRPPGPFRVTAIDTELTVDPRSYRRYASLAAAVDSIDAQRAAQLCGTLKPRIEEAYRELGRDGSFDRALERAIVAILQTPVLDANVRLVPRGGVYGFEDEALENLTPAQKHLARMGPDNVRVIQAKLRQIALAIGIPAARLPQ